MSVIEKLKAASIAERKACGPLAAFSTFVLAEVQKIGKSKGNRDTTEDEAITALKKVQATSAENNNVGEVAWVAALLPQMASDDSVRIFLNSEFGPGAKPAKGDAMKALKAKFGSLVDMKRAGEIYTEMFA